MTATAPASYGDVTGEYLALRQGAGIVSGEHEIVWVKGPDAVQFLEDIVSQQVAGLAVGAVARSLLLAPQGKMRAALWILRHEEGAGLVADSGAGRDVIDDLSRFKLRVDAVIDEAPAPIVELWGPDAAPVVEAAGLPVPVGWEPAGDGATVARADLGSLPRFLCSGIDADHLEAAGGRRCGAAAATTVRIEAGEPKMGVDLDSSTIPQESGLVPAAVDLDKGCFLGQELVARIENRGRVNRVLRGLTITENVLPPPGSQVVGADRNVGTITSVSESLELRAPVALGLLRREVGVGDGVAVRWEGGSTSAIVHDLPFTDFKPP